MKKLSAAALLTAAVLSVPTAAGSKPALAKGVARAGTLILYSETNFNGERLEFVKTRTQVPMEWNIKSVAVAPGESWEVCVKPRFKQPCMTLDASSADASEMGLTGMIGSLRPLKAAKSKAK